MQNKSVEQGSFGMINSELAFNQMGLKKGCSFLDVGCGAGDYSIRAADIVGESGVVYALDRWKDVISSLDAKAISRGIRNIKPMQCDITKRISNRG